MTEGISVRTAVSLPVRQKFVLPPRFVQAMLAGHSALGLAFAAMIYVVCLTGTISVFDHELQRWEQPSAPSTPLPLSPEAIQEAIWSGYGQALIDNAATQVALVAPGPLNSRFLVSYSDPRTGNDGEWIADASGHLTARVRAPWTEFVEDLHKTLHLPRTWGFFFVGLTGVALLSSLISGLLSHPRIFKDAFVLRWGGSQRLQQADLHNRLAAWGLPFHFLIAVTGSLLGLSTLIVGVLALAAYSGQSDQAYAAIFGPQASITSDSAPIPNIVPMIKSVHLAQPGAVFAGVQLERPGKVGQIVRLRMRMPGHLAFANTYFFDGTGKPLSDAGSEAGSIGQQILGALQPVHYGWFGGWGTKFIYGLLGLALTVVTQSGVAVWLARRRDKGRPAPVLERLWAGLVWGLPFALAVTALDGLYTGEDGIPPMFIAAIAAGGFCVLASDNGPLVAKRLKLLTATTLFLLVAAHSKIWWGKSSDSAVLTIDLSILALASMIAPWPLQRAQRLVRQKLDRISLFAQDR